MVTDFLTVSFSHIGEKLSLFNTLLTYHFVEAHQMKATHTHTEIDRQWTEGYACVKFYGVIPLNTNTQTETRNRICSQCKAHISVFYLFVSLYFWWFYSIHLSPPKLLHLWVLPSLLALFILCSAIGKNVATLLHPTGSHCSKPSLHWRGDRRFC